MAWSAAGLQLTNDTSGILPVAFAQGHNNIIMSLRGNQVISGCAPTANGTSDLTNTAQDDIDVASGSAIINGSEVSVSAQSMSLHGTSASNTDFVSGEGYEDTTSGESVLILIYLDGSGNLKAIGGTAGSGTIYPPELPEDVLTVALVLLTNGTPTLQAAAIKDYRIYTSSFMYAAGGKIAGALEVTGTLNPSAGSNKINGLSDNLFNLTDDEVTQLEAIGANTISATQWGYLGALDQGLTQASTPTFGGMTLNGDLDLNGNDLIISAGTITDTELQQLLTIDTVTISNTQWGYLGALDQGLTQASTPTFGGMTLNGDLDLNGNNLYSVNAASRIAIGSVIQTRVGVAINPGIDDDTAATYGISLSPSFVPVTDTNLLVARGLIINPEFDDGGNILTLPEMRVLDIKMRKTSGTITDAYGLFIQSIDQASTSNYAIYTNAGEVSFGDTVTMRGGDLDLNGNNLINGVISDGGYIRVQDYGGETPSNVVASTDTSGTASTLRSATTALTTHYFDGNGCTLRISHPGYSGVGSDGTATGYLEYYNGSSYVTLGSVSLSFVTTATSNSTIVNSTAYGNQGGSARYRLRLDVVSGIPGPNITVSISSGSPTIEEVVKIV